MALGIVFATYQEVPKNDPHLQSILNLTSKYADELCVVSTSEILQSPISNCVYIERPNLGYDLYSYKVGYEHLIKNPEIDKIIFINSSFLVSDFAVFSSFLKDFIQELSESEFVGVSQSRQFGNHFQTYFFGIQIRQDQVWFQNWMDSLRTYDTKFNLIFEGEIGLSKKLNKHRVPCKSMLSRKELNSIEALINFYRYQRKQRSFLGSLKNLLFLGPNPVHASFAVLERRTGIVKKELLQTNPYGLDLNVLFSKYSHLKEYSQTEKGLKESPRWGNENTKYFEIIKGPRHRIAIVLHMHHGELIDEFVEYLRRIPEPFDLFITTSRESLVPQMIDEFLEVSQFLTITVGPNIGRDVAPFLFLFRSRKLDIYDAVLKIHSKKSSYSKQGDRWRKLILSELLSSTVQIDTTIRAIQNQEFGMVGPSMQWLSSEEYWGSSTDEYNRLAKEMALGEINVTSLGFFSGTMFWFNPISLVSLHQLPEESIVFQKENGQIDGTLAHALERIFPHCVHASQFKVTGVNASGIFIETNYLQNSLKL
jgi:rhamnosyltransferase